MFKDLQWVAVEDVVVCCVELCVCVFGVLVGVFLTVFVWELCLCVVRMFLCVANVCVRVSSAFKFQTLEKFKNQISNIQIFRCFGPLLIPRNPISQG